jgi:hypothetical protein
MCFLILSVMYEMVRATTTPATMLNTPILPASLSSMPSDLKLRTMTADQAPATPAGSA